MSSSISAFFPLSPLVTEVENSVSRLAHHVGEDPLVDCQQSDEKQHSDSDGEPHSDEAAGDFDHDAELNEPWIRIRELEEFLFISDAMNSKDFGQVNRTSDADITSAPVFQVLQFNRSKKRDGSSILDKIKPRSLRVVLDDNNRSIGFASPDSGREMQWSGLILACTAGELLLPHAVTRQPESQDPAVPTEPVHILQQLRYRSLSSSPFVVSPSLSPALMVLTDSSLYLIQPYDANAPECIHQWTSLASSIAQSIRSHSESPAQLAKSESLAISLSHWYRMCGALVRIRINQLTQSFTRFLSSEIPSGFGFEQEFGSIRHSGNVQWMECGRSGSSASGVWKRRWIECTANGILAVYDSRSSHRLKLAIPLHYCRLINDTTALCNGISQVLLTTLDNNYIIRLAHWEDFHQWWTHLSPLIALSESAAGSKSDVKRSKSRQNGYSVVDSDTDAVPECWSIQAIQRWARGVVFRLSSVSVDEHMESSLIHPAVRALVRRSLQQRSPASDDLADQFDQYCSLLTRATDLTMTKSQRQKVLNSLSNHLDSSASSSSQLVTNDLIEVWKMAVQSPESGQCNEHLELIWKAIESGSPISSDFLRQYKKHDHSESTQVSPSTADQNLSTSDWKLMIEYHDKSAGHTIMNTHYFPPSNTDNSSHFIRDFTIGRDTKSNDLHVNDPFVSRNHGKFTWIYHDQPNEQGLTLEYEDLQSTYGSSLNARSCKHCIIPLAEAVRDGYQLKLGRSCIIRFGKVQAVDHMERDQYLDKLHQKSGRCVVM